MNRFKRAVLWAALIAIILLAASRSTGPSSALSGRQAFFNSLPLAVYWFALIALLIAGIALFRRLLRIPALLLMHVGSVLVLLGALWGSNGGHAVAKQLFGIDKIPQASCGSTSGYPENRVEVAGTHDLRELPFSVRLKEYSEEYYEPGQLVVRSRDGPPLDTARHGGPDLVIGPGIGHRHDSPRLSEFQDQYRERSAGHV